MEMRLLFLRILVIFFIIKPVIATQIPGEKYFVDINKLPKPYATKSVPNSYNKLDIERYDNSFIKMFISQKTDDDMYDKFVARLYDTLNIYELNIFEDSGDVTSSVREDILEQGEDTLTFLGKYIDQLDTTLDKQKLKDYTKELYTEVGENA